MIGRKRKITARSHRLRPGSSRLGRHGIVQILRAHEAIGHPTPPPRDPPRRTAPAEVRKSDARHDPVATMMMITTRVAMKRLSSQTAWRQVVVINPDDQIAQPLVKIGTKALADDSKAEAMVHRVDNSGPEAMVRRVDNSGPEAMVHRVDDLRGVPRHRPRNPEADHWIVKSVLLSVTTACRAATKAGQAGHPSVPRGRIHAKAIHRNRAARYLVSRERRARSSAEGGHPVACHRVNAADHPESERLNPGLFSIWINTSG